MAGLRRLSVDAYEPGWKGLLHLEKPPPKANFILAKPPGACKGRSKSNAWCVRRSKVIARVDPLKALCLEKT